MFDLRDVRPDLDACTACGACLEACPTYSLDAVELDSPRGRIALVADALEHGGVTEAMRRHIDRCLGCQECVTTCPVGVRYDRILHAARTAIEHSRPRHGAEQALRLAAFETLPYPGRLRAIAPVVRAGRRAPAGWLPGAARRLAGVLPDPPSRAALRTPLPERTPAAGPHRGRVALLLGCVQRVFLSDVHRASVAVLAAEGFEVLAPALPDCCGAFELGAGESEHALARARATVAAFATLSGGPAEAVLATAGRCTTAMRSYGELFDDPDVAAFSASVQEVTAFLAALPARAPRGPVALRAVLYESCTLARGGPARGAARALLAGVPELRLLDPSPVGHGCCGGAGLHPLLEPETARRLRGAVLDDLLAGDPEVILTTDPGCAAQLAAGLRARSREIPVAHPLELLWRSLQAAPRTA
jgi:glycolate oxidase iron-sulfur subunit